MLLSGFPLPARLHLGRVIDTKERAVVGCTEFSMGNVTSQKYILGVQRRSAWPSTAIRGELRQHRPERWIGYFESFCKVSTDAPRLLGFAQRLVAETSS